MISIIIPTYNRRHTIERAIRSVLDQTYRDIELIVVDDCSSDGTEELVLSIDDDRVRYHKLDKNSGACVARNAGIELSKGEYIAFQDSDDVWHLDKLEKQILALEKTNADVLFCSFVKHKITAGADEIVPGGIGNEFVTYQSILRSNPVSTQCIIGKRKCFEMVKFDPSLPRLQDWDLALELSKRYSIYHLNDVLVDMYIQNDSISANPQKGIIAMEILLEKNKEQLALYKDILSNWYVYLGNYTLENKLNPAKYYKKSLSYKFSKEIFAKYILSILHIIIPIYIKKGVIKK